MLYYLSLFLLLSLQLGTCLGYLGLGNSRVNVKETPVFKHLGRWCCLNDAEFAKCEDWRIAVNQTVQVNVLLECVLGTDKFDCFKKIFNDEADLMTADAGEVYTAGKFYNLMPIATEMYLSPSGEVYGDQYAVAVVKKGWLDGNGRGKIFDGLFPRIWCL